MMLEESARRVALLLEVLLFVEVFELAVFAVAMTSLNNNMVSLPVRAGKPQAFFFGLFAESEGLAVR